MRHRVTSIETLISAGKSELNAMSTRLSPSIFNRVSLFKCASMSTHQPDPYPNIFTRSYLSSHHRLLTYVNPLTWSSVLTVLCKNDCPRMLCSLKADHHNQGRHRVWGKLTRLQPWDTRLPKTACAVEQKACSLSTSLSFEEQPDKVPSFIGIMEQALPRADPLFRCQSRPAVRPGIVISSLCLFSSAWCYSTDIRRCAATPWDVLLVNQTDGRRQCQLVQRMQRIRKDYQQHISQMSARNPCAAFADWISLLQKASLSSEVALLPGV